jgi:phosphatidylserine/phosphatidylglycerophosphate/cardiolipin synthase-like enzyme
MLLARHTSIQKKMLIDVINSAKETLDIAIYSLTHPDIVAAIKEAKKRGVVVRIILIRFNPLSI